MISAWLLLQLAAASPVAATPAPADAPLVLEPGLLAVMKGEAPQRLLDVSHYFVGKPYAFSPLGEGGGPDQDPRFRTDEFDCLTFVETSIALAEAKDPAEVQPLLDQIRYARDQVAYPQRNHVMEAQWIPNNEHKGFIEDITRKVAGDDVVKVTKHLDDAAWASKSGKALSLAKTDQAHGDFSWEMVPVAKALKYLEQAPDGTVVTVIRGDKKSLVTRISHVGFLVHLKGAPYLRHASRSFGKVTEEPLAHYLARNLGFAKWVVEGFGLYAVKRPSPPVEPSEPLAKPAETGQTVQTGQTAQTAVNTTAKP